MDQPYNSGAPQRDGKDSKRAKKPRRRFSILRLIGKFFLTIFTLLVIGALTLAIFFQIFMTYVNTTLAPTLAVEVEDVTLMLSSTLYDRNGKEMRTLYADENRELVEYSQIPDHMIKALVAIEDKRFYTHEGVDWEGTIAAFYKTFTSGSTRGGSTITQQLLRNITEDTDVTVKRKIREIFRALEFEKTTSKEDILEMYLNRVYFGQSCYGVQAASKMYFGKDVSELSLAESAAIIGITNNPYQYDPYLGFTFKQEDGTVLTSMDMNKQRQELILDEMCRQEIIDEATRDAAKAEKLLFTITDEYKALQRQAEAAEETEGTEGEEGTEGTEGEAAEAAVEEDDGGGRDVYSWFEDAVIEDAIELVMEAKGCARSMAVDLIYSGGYHIYTTIDPEIQAIVDEVYLDRANFDYPSAKGTPLDSAITIVDPYTGDVVAMAGGVGEKLVDRGLNLATSRRPCGSAIKPVSVYAPAFEYNIVFPGSVLDDYPLRLNDSETAGYPKNSNNRYRGMLTVSYAIQWSTNTISARTLEKVGYGPSFEFMENSLGFDLLDSDMVLAPLSMGGLTQGVTTEEMAAAFAAFANSGLYTAPRTITKILDNDGNVVVDNASDSRPAMKESTAYLMNRMLTRVVSGGTGGSASFSDMTIAGKTGTTSNNFDRYFVGYTPYYSAAVWVGYAQSNEKINSGSTNPAALVWKQVMEEIHAGLENRSFPERPSGVSSVSVCLDCGLKATDLCSADVRGSRVSSFEVQEGAAPTESCTCHVQIAVCPETNMMAGEYCPEEGLTTQVIINPARAYVAAPGATETVNEDGTITPPAYIAAEDDPYTLRYMEQQGTCTLHDEFYVPPVDPETWPDWLLPFQPGEWTEGDPAIPPYPDGTEEPDVPLNPVDPDAPADPDQGGEGGQTPADPDTGENPDTGGEESPPEDPDPGTEAPVEPEEPSLPEEPALP